MTWSEIYCEHNIGVTNVVTKLLQIVCLKLATHLWLSIIFSISFAFRSTLAMDFTVTNSNLILTRSQKCGLRVIVDGKPSLVVPNNLAVRMGCWMLFRWI